LVLLKYFMVLSQYFMVLPEYVLLVFQRLFVLSLVQDVIGLDVRAVGEDPVELFSRNAVPAARSRTRGFRPATVGHEQRSRSTGPATTAGHPGEVLALVPQRLPRLSWADDDWDATTAVEFGIGVLDSERTEVRVTRIGREQFGARALAMRMAHEAGWRGVALISCGGSA
jgi:hypothetical protein